VGFGGDAQASSSDRAASSASSPVLSAAGRDRGGALRARTCRKPTGPIVALYDTLLRITDTPVIRLIGVA